MIDYKVEEMKKKLSEKIIDRIYYLNNMKIVYQKKEDEVKVQEIELDINILRNELENINLLSNSNFLEFLKNMELNNNIYNILSEEDIIKVYGILKEFDNFNKKNVKLIDIKKDYKSVCDKILFTSNAYERVCFDIDIINSEEFNILEKNVYSAEITDMKYISNEMRELFKEDIDVIEKNINKKRNKPRVYQLQRKLYDDIKKHVKFIMELFLEQQDLNYDIDKYIIDVSFVTKDYINNLFGFVNKVYINNIKELKAKKAKLDGVFIVANEMEDKKIKALNNVSSEFVNSLNEDNIDLFQYSVEDFVDGVSKSNLFEEINNRKHISK